MDNFSRLDLYSSDTAKSPSPSRLHEKISPNTYETMLNLQNKVTALYIVIN